MLFGVSMALVASLGWAVSSIILKLVSGALDSVSINVLRLWVGSGALLTLITRQRLIPRHPQRQLLRFAEVVADPAEGR